jgi:DNA-binding CsgD family transcriptional regulator
LNGRLVAQNFRDQLVLDEALQRMIRGASEDIARDPKPILIERGYGERPLAAYVLPASAAPPVENFLTHTRAIVLAIDPSEASAPADPALVRDVLGITLGEARVAALVGAGVPPRDAAAKLGLTEQTVRTALKRVFAKVGVSRQSELTALLAKLVLR